MQNNVEELLLTAGRYYIGDPCYAFNREDWEELLESTDYFQNANPFELRGRSFVAFNTDFGDGDYKGSDGFNYGVDAGLIGAIPIELVDKEKLADIVKFKLGRIVEFDSSFYVSTNGEGLLCFGDIEIDTAAYDEEEDYYEEDESEEEYEEDEAVNF